MAYRLAVAQLQKSVALVPVKTSPNFVLEIIPSIFGSGGEQKGYRAWRIGLLARRHKESRRAAISSSRLVNDNVLYNVLFQAYRAIVC
jgi:hypothetical protein